jgi:hypothetical protein
MPTTNATHDYVSIGQLAAHTQRSVRSIEQAASELDITPAMRLNFVPHFDGEQIERISSHLATEANR